MEQLLADYYKHPTYSWHFCPLLTVSGGVSEMQLSVIILDYHAKWVDFYIGCNEESVFTVVIINRTNTK